MKICFNDMLYSLSYALDCVEHELVGVTTYHSKRIAYLSVQLGKYFKLTVEELLDLAACAALHDNALTEYIENEYKKRENLNVSKSDLEIGKHCLLGEKNISKMPFFGNIKGVILFHHECADGNGPFGKTSKETPLYARIIHLCDQLDAMFDLSMVDTKKYEAIKVFLKQQEDKLFDGECVNAFIKSINYEILNLMNNNQIESILNQALPFIEREYSFEELIHLSSFYANIVDYKSEFTKNHSIGVAKKCMKMAKYYGYDKEKQAKLYFAGALHDIGKLVVARDILEKPDKLTEEEYKQVKTHAYYTYQILNKIKGLEDITRWASFHHEKLAGNGYPFGKNKFDLEKEERLMACIDIYQALTEERPYKDRIKHNEAINIMQKMVNENELDGNIVKDINAVFHNEKNSVSS